MVGTSNLGSWDSQWLKPANDRKYQEAGLVWRRLLHLRVLRVLEPAGRHPWRAPYHGGKLPRARIAWPVLHPTSQLTSKLKAAANGGFGMRKVWNSWLQMLRRLASQTWGSGWIVWGWQPWDRGGWGWRLQHGRSRKIPGPADLPISPQCFDVTAGGGWSFLTHILLGDRTIMNYSIIFNG